MRTLNDHGLAAIPHASSGCSIQVRFHTVRIPGRNNPRVKASSRIPGWLMLVAAMSAIGPVSIDMYLPGFPLIEREFAEHGVERTMAGFLIGISIGQLVYGPVSDRFGRKPPLYFGSILYVVGALGCLFATSMTMLTAMRVLQALGACSGMVISRAIVRDRCEPHEAARAFAMLMVIVSLGPILAPMGGGWFVSHLGWRSVFVFQCVFALGLIIAMHMLLTESRDPQYVVPLSFRAVVASYKRLLLDRQFVGYSLLGGFGMGSVFAFVAGSPIVLIPMFALSPQAFGWLLGMNGLAFMSASRINVIALRNRSPDALLARVIWVPTCMGLALIALTMLDQPPLWSVIAMQFLFFLGFASASPHVSALALAPHAREAGSAAALMGALQSGIAMLAAVIVATFSDGTLRTLATIMTAGALCAVASYLWVRTDKDKQAAAQRVG